MSLAEGEGGVFRLLVDEDCVYDQTTEGGSLPTARALCERLATRLTARADALEALDEEEAGDPVLCAWRPPA